MFSNSIAQALARLRLVVPQLERVKAGDLRYLIFVQNFVVAATVDPNNPTRVGPIPQNFPGGSIVFGLTSSSTPRTQPAIPTLGPRERFRVRFNYSTNESLSTDLAIADAVTGSGRESIVPVKEVYLPPQQNILATVENLTTEDLLVSIGYHTLTWRYAQ